jgi:predicted ATPase
MECMTEHDAGYRALFSDKRMVADLIRHRAASSPLLLVMEGAHWLDDLSREMLDYVATQVAGMPILLLTVYRPPEIESQSPLWTTPPEPFTEVRLGPFTPQESRELIHLKLAGRDLPPTLVTQVEQMAQGNPFFVDEFVNLLQAQGVNLEDSRSLDDLRVPDSLHALIVSRLDQLAESERMTIRIASVSPATSDSESAASGYFDCVPSQP